MKTMCPHACHHSGSVATHELGRVGKLFSCMHNREGTENCTNSTKNEIPLAIPKAPIVNL